MAKKEEYDEDDEEKNPKLYFDKLTISALIAFIILSELFLYILGTKTGAPFGLKEIIFALFAGISITLFLIWIRFILASNKYMGAFISIAGIASVTYALTRKYQGVYTTIFLSIGIILSLVYVIFYFINLNKK